MGSHVPHNFTAFIVILMFVTILPVKGQRTLHSCENADPSNIIVEELNVEAIRQLNKQFQRMHTLLSEIVEQIQTQHDVVLSRLEAIDRRLHGHDISIKNETQDSLKLAIGLPVIVEISIDLGDIPVLLPVVGNWIVLMHRFDGSVNFSRNWTEYKNGFGDLSRGEFWLGNKKIHRLTNRFFFNLRVEVQLNATGSWFYADYASFSLDSEVDKYALSLSGFSGGNAGDALTNTSVETKFYHDGMRFSTSDSDNDLTSTYNCADGFRAGWWFNSCWHTCLTCPYDGVKFLWTHSTDWKSSGRLRAVRMMIKST